MSSHCYVGATDPDNPHLAHTRFVLSNGRPRMVLPTLAAVWAGRARYDTRALVTAILAYDWEYLDPYTPASLMGLAGHRPVPGVGMALTSTGATVDGPEPVTVFPLCHARHLDADWIYLIDVGTATVAVHADDGSCIGRYPLAGCIPPSDATGGRGAGSGRVRAAA
ncbi:hypothetical protein [Micromonospora coxensis]|uniref:hypothetical protein n=1 Tax=Micromonospora coxensis TaxID=356852 RepID=UPI00343F5A52